MTVEETLILVWCAILLINNVELIFKYRSNKDKYIELQDSGAFMPIS
jgi:VIT1/CCC1 family predicted Fe2+/Mn2+ transporter